MSVESIIVHLTRHPLISAEYINQLASRWESHDQTVSLLYLVELYVRRSCPLVKQDFLDHLAAIQMGYLPVLPEQWALHSEKVRRLHLPPDVIESVFAFKQLRMYFPACCAAVIESSSPS